MKFKITFKDPDCMVDCPGHPDVDYVDQLPKEAKDAAEKYLEWSEYVSLEFDTEENTVRVMEVGE